MGHLVMICEHILIKYFCRKLMVLIFKCRQGKEFWLMHLLSVHYVILSHLPEEQVLEFSLYPCIFLARFLFNNVLGFWHVCFKFVLTFIFLHWSTLQFYDMKKNSSGRYYGFMRHQFLLWQHGDCNSDSPKYCCSYHWSRQVSMLQMISTSLCIL